MRHSGSNRKVGLTGTNTLSVVALAEESVNTTDWECETSLGRTAVRRMMSVCADWDCKVKNASIFNRKTRLKKATNCDDGSESERGEYLRLRARLGTAGLASGLASSHFGWM